MARIRRKEDIRPFLQETASTSLNQIKAPKDITNWNDDDTTAEPSESGNYCT
jgi:hypothetical protein